MDKLNLSMFFMLLVMVSGCSNLQRLDTETKVLAGALATAAVVEATDNPNGGITHGIISFGLSHTASKVGDAVFPHPDDEWAADTVAIVGALAPTIYYGDKESGDSLDSKADFILPLGNFLYTAYRRLSYEQEPDPVPVFEFQEDSQPFNGFSERDKPEPLDTLIF